MTQIVESRKPITFWYCAGAIAPIRAIRYLTPSHAVSVWSEERIVQFANVQHTGKVYLVRRTMSDCGRWGEWETYVTYPPYYLI